MKDSVSPQAGGLPWPPRIVVIGSTGSGKSTVAGLLSRLLDAPHVEMDALNWRPGWTTAPAEEFRALVADAVEADSWIVDGNYRRTRDLVWPRANLAVWLDYNFLTVLRQLVARTFRRAFGNELLWNTNHERLWEHFFTRESLFLWLVRTHWASRKTYTRLLSEPGNSHISVVRLHSRRETRKWLERIGSSG